jgi:ribose-phosphate pyrophosphokinase
MIANLLNVAGVDHVITIDLHSSQMQGFFKCPVDNLVAEPLLANWIKRNIPDWKRGVVMSKNPGGTRRVTSLADALELNFAIVTTDTRVRGYDNSSVDGSLKHFDEEEEDDEEKIEKAETLSEDHTTSSGVNPPSSPRPLNPRRRTLELKRGHQSPRVYYPPSPLSKSTRPSDHKDFAVETSSPLAQVQTEPLPELDSFDDDFIDEVG